MKGVKTALNIAFPGPTLTVQMIADDLETEEAYIRPAVNFVCERGDGQLIAGREDNICVIETVPRGADYEEFYLQILDDRKVQRKTYSENAKEMERKVVVWTTLLSKH